MTDNQIKHMVNRFLSWKLPENFNPDNGISAERPNYGPGVTWEPMGTNLLDYTQAEAMVRHMLDEMPTQPFDDATVALGEALGGLSARMLAAGFLEDDDNHAHYEEVVAAFNRLPRHPQGG